MSWAGTITGTESSTRNSGGSTETTQSGSRAEMWICTELSEMDHYLRLTQWVSNSPEESLAQCLYQCQRPLQAEHQPQAEHLVLAPVSRLCHGGQLLGQGSSASRGSHTKIGLIEFWAGILSQNLVTRWDPRFPGGPPDDGYRRAVTAGAMRTAWDVDPSQRSATST